MTPCNFCSIGHIRIQRLNAYSETMFRKWWIGLGESSDFSSCGCWSFGFHEEIRIMHKLYNYYVELTCSCYSCEIHCQIQKKKLCVYSFPQICQVWIIGFTWFFFVSSGGMLGISCSFRQSLLESENNNRVWRKSWKPASYQNLGLIPPGWFWEWGY